MDRLGPPSQAGTMKMWSAMPARIWLGKNGYLFLRQRPGSDLLLQLSKDSVGRRFTVFAVPPDDIPHTRLRGAVFQSPGQQGLVAAGAQVLLGQKETPAQDVVKD